MSALEVLLTMATSPPAIPTDANADSPWLTQPIATLVGGLMVAVGAGLGFVASSDTRRTMERSASMTDERERQTARQIHQRETMSARQGRYTVVAEQLASPYLPVRLAGVYALGALADEWQEDNELGQRDVAIELLCAYLRASPQPVDDQETKAAILSLFRSHIPSRERVRTFEERTVKNDNFEQVYPYLWPTSSLRFTGGDLCDLDFSGHNLRGVDFENAKLAKCNLTGADISGADFTGADLSSAQLGRSDLEHALLWNVNLSNANLTKANLWWAELDDANLAGARLYGADLSGADLSGADLSEALIGANGNEETIFCFPVNRGERSSANIVVWDSTTLWPDGFDIEAVVTRQLWEENSTPAS